MPEERSRRLVTTGPIRQTLFLLALPVLGEQILNGLVGTFDVFLAGKISAVATSAIGLAAYLTWLVSMLAMLVGTGTTALIARMTGQGDSAEVNRVTNESIAMAFILGVIAFGFVYVIAPWFAVYCKMEGEAYRITVDYLRINAIGLAFTTVTLIGSAALRGIGNMRTPMLIFAFVNAINIVVSSSLVFGFGPIPQLGITGIAVGTVTAQLIGAIIMTLVLARGRSGLSIKRQQLRISSARTKRILRIGIPAAADGAIMWSGHFIYLAIISRLADPPLGVAYFAAHIIAVRVEAFTYLPAVAWAAACATMIGQSLGSGDPQRAKRTGHEGVLQCGALGILVAVCFFFGAETIFGIMSSDSLVRQVGIPPFRILAIMTPLLVVSIVYVGGLRGAGDTRYPMLITLVGVVIRITGGYVGGIVLQGGLLGVWAGMFCDMIWRALAASIRFARGKWVHTKV